MRIRGFASVLMIVALVSLAACGGEGGNGEGETTANPVVGMWSAADGGHVEFKADGTLAAEGMFADMEPAPTMYEVVDNKLQLKAADGTMVAEMDMMMSGDTVELTHGETTHTLTKGH